MKLTKSERHTAYIIMLAEAEKRESADCYLCDIIASELDESDCHIRSTDFRINKHFPELKNKRPSSGSAYWFPTNDEGKQKRIEILKQCIMERAVPKTKKVA